MPWHTVLALGAALLLRPLAALAALGGAPTMEAFTALVQTLRAGPAARAAFAEDCTRSRAGEPEAVREAAARLLRVEPREVDHVLCEREALALAMGRIGYDDFLALAAGRSEPLRVARVLTALRSVAAPGMTPDQFAALARRLRTDAAFRQERVQACGRQLDRLWPRAERRRWAGRLGVGEGEAVPAYCRRLNAAIAGGSLDYEAWLGLTAGGVDPRHRERALAALQREAAPYP